MERVSEGGRERESVCVCVCVCVCDARGLRAASRLNDVETGSGDRVAPTARLGIRGGHNQ